TARDARPALTRSPAGVYPIVPTLVDPAGRLENYTVQTVNGVLTVFAGPLTGTCLGAPTRQVLPPLDAAGNNLFNQGRTVPVKFRVCDGNGRSIGDPSLITSFRLVQIITAEGTSRVDVEPVSTNGRPGFRFDEQQWVFNLDTKPLAAGATYVYKVSLVDTTAIEFRFRLR